MESSNASFPGSGQANLKRSFSRGLRCLLSACPAEEFHKAFPTFTAPEQERLHHLFCQVVSTVHQNIEKIEFLEMTETCEIIEEHQLEEFESTILQTQAGTVLDYVEELVEEQTLDPLHSKKSNVGEMAQKLSEIKKNEVNHLMGLLEKMEEQKREIKARVEQLKKEKQDFSGAANLVNELRTRIMNNEIGYHT